MSWLLEGAETREDLLALHPALAAAHRHLFDEVWQASVDARILELCRLRTATILGNTRAWDEPRSAAAVAAGLDQSLVANLARWPTHPGFDAAAKACLSLAEQYVIDVHGITDAMVTEVERHIGPGGVITLTTALAAWELTHRFDNALLTSPSEGDA